MHYAGRVLTGISYAGLCHEAFDAAAAATSDRPFSVLCLTQQDDTHDALREYWTEHGSLSQLRVMTLDEFVGDCYQAVTTQGLETHIRQDELYRLVELALENELAGTPLQGGRTVPGAGPIRQAEQLLSLVRFAGLLSPSEIETGLSEKGLETQGEAIATLQAAFDKRRDKVFDTPVTTRAERYDEVAGLSQPLAEVFGPLDAVVVSGFPNLSALDTAVLDRVSDAYPTVAIHPLVAGPSAGAIDRGTADVVDVLTDIGFESRHITPEKLSEAASMSTPHFEERAQRMAGLYQHDVGTDGPLSGISLYEVPTPTEELRQIARDIRTRLADGTAPDDIAVYLPDTSQYARQFAVACRQYDVPVTVETEVPLSGTAVGSVLESVIELSEPTATPETLVALLGNPLVHLETPADHDVDGGLARSVSQVATRLTVPQMNRLLEAVSAPVATELESLLERCRDLRTTPLPEAIDTLRELIDELGVVTALEQSAQTSQDTLAIELEMRALETVRTELATLEQAASAYDGSTQSVDRLRRLVRLSDVSGRSGSGDRSVTVYRLQSAVTANAEVAYVPGLTTEHFPESPTELRFSEPIKEAAPEFDSPDPRAVCEQAVACLLATTPETQLSYPQQTIDGDEFVVAPIVREIRRVTDLEANQIPEPTPGTAEDLQRELADHIVAHRTQGPDGPPMLAAAESFGDNTVRPDSGSTPGADDDLDEVSNSEPDPGADGPTGSKRDTEAQADDPEPIGAALEAIAANDGVSEQQTTRLRSGIRLASHRRHAELTAYDGLLSAGQVDTLHSEDDRYPLSPSRIERYARCGFKYYMRTVLGFEEPEEIGETIDHRDRGQFIHETLATFLDTIGDGDVVDPSAHDRETLEEDLLRIAREQLAAIDVGDSVFDRRWLETVFAGLGEQAENPYYAADRGEATPAGLLVSFLNKETNLWEYTGTRPWLPEQRVGASTFGTRSPLQADPVEVATPTGPVSIHGQIDRIDVVEGVDIDATPIAVRDYKTGGTPSGDETVDGINFQLPVYALLAEAGLGPEKDVETIAGAYYRVRPPQSVYEAAGQISSEPFVSHAFSNDETPLTHYNSGYYFDTHADFRTFISQTTPRRIGRIDRGISAGVFAPTFVEQSDAGCRYCPYSEACDVRPERRQEKVKTIEVGSDQSAYLPPRARQAGINPQPAQEAEAQSDADTAVDGGGD